MYPLLFLPIYKERVWGGRKMERFGRMTPFDHTGESWDISMRTDEMSVVSNGVYAGQRFCDVVNAEGGRAAWLGSNFAFGDFPLLYKIIDANDNLSVQVHPDDSQALELEGPACEKTASPQNATKADTKPRGKNEMWYVLDAPQNSRLVIGLKPGTDKPAFAEAITQNRVEDLLGYVPVKRGDIINIPAGTLHAITRGVVVAEIQQNSDITYRVYDYGRLGLDGKPRQLHVEKSLKVLSAKPILNTPTVGVTVGQQTYYIANSHFCCIGYDLKPGHDIAEKSDPLKFYVFTCVDGHVTVESANRAVELQTSQSVFIPASMGEYKLCGCGYLLKSFVPHIANDFIAPLLKSGHNKDVLKNCSLPIDYGRRGDLI
ncbi:MAG: class I mannose-6-phosphate isomerase [Clostridiales bacterium]|jgi:mannose-6-phosphate isomerase|nr:class I mannose-6-phosphate isomerase [Clostridiales bacterium]